MTEPAWEEKLLDKLIYIHEAGYNCQDYETWDMLKGFFADLFASELQAVLGEERTQSGLAKDVDPEVADKTEVKMSGKDWNLFRELERNYGYNAHYQECLKRGRERGIIN